MDKSLLIHSSNTPRNVQKHFENKNIINFNYDNNQYSTIDKYISKVIILVLKDKDFNLIYIKDSLSSNYLELYGLLVAYHIRLSTELKNKRYIPIVVLSDIDGFSINRIVPMAKILFTQNIFLEKNNKETILKYKQKNISLLTDKKYLDFLNNINIEAPENSSNHSIANEWAIYRWSEFLKVESKAIQNNREKISSMLYFKYLLAKNPIEIKKKNGIQFVPRPPENSGKILYIDDEWAKGWSDILEKYFSKNENIEFETFEYDFKNNNKFTTMSAIKNSCQEYTPDVVLLDLRLTQSDHETQEITNLTGIKITKMIKEINPAIQIIMLTATGKSIVLESLYEHGILGYIKKEHPNDIGISTKENFDKLKNLVDKGLDKKYLKEIWNIQNRIKPFNSNIKIEIDSVFEIVDSDMKNRFIYAMFAIVKSIEMINDYYIIDGYQKATWKDTKEEFSDNSTKNKIYMILEKKLNLKDEVINRNIAEIIKIRNNTIHPKRGRREEINKDNILTWFKMLETILKKIDEVDK